MFITWNSDDNDWREDETIPDDLKACIEFVAESGCQWLCFDHDVMAILMKPIDIAYQNVHGPNCVGKIHFGGTMVLDGKGEIV